MQPKKPWPIGLKAITLFAAVLALGLMCIAAPRAVGRLAPIWLPNAVILSAYLRSPRRQWWVIALAGGAGNLAANVIAGDHSGVAFSLVGANLLECLACATAIRRLRGDRFDVALTADLARLAWIVAPCVTVSALISSTAVHIFRGDAFAHSLWTWMASHVLGYFILAPCLLLLSRARAEDEPRLREHGWTLLVLTAVVVVTFAQSDYPLLFLIPPALLLVTWRLELLGSALGVLLTTAIGTVFSLAGHGPTSLAHGDAGAKIVVLQAFLVVAILASLPVANQRALSRRLQASLSKALQLAKEDAFRLEMATNVARLGHWSLDVRTGTLAWSRQMYEIFGLAPDGDVDLAAAMGRVHPDDAPECQRLVDRAVQFGEDYVQDRIRIFRPDGEMRVTGGAVICQRDETGAVVALFGALSDKTEQEETRLQRGLLEQRYVEIAGKASDIVLRLDPDGVCLSVNPACESVLGYGVEEIVGSTLGWLVHPEDYDKVRMALLAIRMGQAGGERLLYRARHKDGHWKWLESQPQALRDPFSGQVLETSDVIRDVTERTEQEASLRDAEQAARQTNSLMRAAEKLAHMGYVSYDLVSGEMTWSDEVWRIFEADPAQDVAGVALMTARRHPDDRDRVLTDFEAAVAGGAQIYETSYRLITPGGALRHVMTRGHIERLDGRAIRVFGVVMDVTDLRVAEQTARESEQRYRLMAENATDVIITCALDGAITFASPALKTVTGFEPEDLIGKTALEVCHPDDRRAIEANFMRIVTGGAPERLRWRGRHRDEARWIWFESSPALLLDPDSAAPSGYLDVIRDITAQKEQEDALAQARLEAERAMRSKADFLANMSHELRTPLNSIIGFSRLLAERDTLLPEDRRQMDLVHGAGQALHAVIDNVLDFSKLEASALTLDPTAFDVIALARKTLALLEPQALDKGIRLDFTVGGPETLWVRGDVGRLRQVLLNYLSNAVKFTKEGRVGVRLDVEREAGGHVEFRIAVTDTGVGVAPDKLAGLFSRFTQADASTAARYGGTGLGLAISKQLIGLMGGSVGAQSMVGEGSTFWLALDLPTAEAAPSRPADEGQTSAFAGRAILVVDDVDLNRQLMSALLAKQGCVVDLAENGAEALQRLETAAYDLVLMDCQMPVMDGFAATRAIRSSGKPFATTPIVALTASADVAHLARCDAAGMDAHLTKPLNPGSLEAMMRRFLLDPRPAATGHADPVARQALVEALGEDALTSLLDLLLVQLGEKLRSDEPAPVREDAHALAGASGLMGFAALSEACRDLERAVEAGEPFGESLAEVRRLMAGAEAESRQWLGAMSASMRQIA